MGTIGECSCGQLQEVVGMLRGMTTTIIKGAHRFDGKAGHGTSG